MVLETPILPYAQWLAENIRPFLLALLGVAGAGILLGYLAAPLRHGPAAAFRMTFATLGTGLRELAQLSPRRLWAIRDWHFRNQSGAAC